MLLDLAQVASTLPDTPTIASALTLIGVVAKGMMDHKKGSRRDSYTNRQLGEIKRELSGVKEKMGEIDKSVVSIEAELRGREKERGERDRLHGLYTKEASQ